MLGYDVDRDRTEVSRRIYIPPPQQNLETPFEIILYLTTITVHYYLNFDTTIVVVILTVGLFASVV